MTLDEAIEFIVAKFELVAQHCILESERDEVRKFAAGLQPLWDHPRLSLAQLRSLDGEMLDQFLDHYVSNENEAKVRRQLVARFKTSRLRPPDRKVVKRVLKRGEIADLEEYYQIKEFVAFVDNMDEIGEENYGILDSLLESYDGLGEETPEPTPIPTSTGNTPASRRRPPPPFDLLLVADEKLCPADTPLEIRISFVQSKFARLIERSGTPEARQSLEQAAKHSVEFALGATTPPERRAAQLEWTEHEADYFGGHAISGATHRAVEDELEKEFGFRRLGPSAQARLARMLATNDALGPDNRLFIRRFIYSYPHQTLFTSAEIKRAERLLNQPSPSQAPAPAKVLPRPRTPPDMTQLCVGAVFDSTFSDKPCRVIAFDEFEVFYEVDWGGSVGWSAGLALSRIGYYRHITPLFLQQGKRIRVDEPSPKYLALHRPDLPMRFGRSATLQWHERAFATREEFFAHIQSTEPSLLDQPPLRARKLVLTPRSPKGALQKSVVVSATQGDLLPIADVLWAAHQVQRPLKAEQERGIGFYRSGHAKRGVPSYVIGGYMDFTLRWFAEAPLGD